MPRVYIASGLGFSVTTRAFYYDVLLPKVRSAGLMPLDPWANGANGLKNEELIETAIALLAVLDGPDVDSGTAAEVGWAAARGIFTVGWRSDLRRAGEHDGVVINLQVQYFIERHGGLVHNDLDRAVGHLARSCKVE